MCEFKCKFFRSKVFFTQIIEMLLDWPLILSASFNQGSLGSTCRLQELGHVEQCPNHKTHQGLQGDWV